MCRPSMIICIDLKEDGSFRMNMKYFDYCAGLRMTNQKFSRLFGGPPRKPEAPLTQREMDLARSLQEVTEEIMLRMSRHVQKETGEKNLVLAGGVALELRRKRHAFCARGRSRTSGSSRRREMPAEPWARRSLPGTRILGTRAQPNGTQDSPARVAPRPGVLRRRD